MPDDRPPRRPRGGGKPPDGRTGARRTDGRSDRSRRPGGSEGGGVGRPSQRRDGRRPSPKGRSAGDGRAGERPPRRGDRPGRPEPSTEAERRAAEVRARRGPRVPKDPDLERRKIEDRTLDEWIDEGDIRAEARAASRRAAAPGSSGRSRDRRRPVDSGTAATIDDLVGAQRGARLNERLAAAATALERNRLDEAQRIIRPLVDELPQVGAVRRVAGLVAYRLGRWRRAVDELEAAQALDPSVEHLPVLADANRALRRWTRVEQLWAEIRAESPAHEVMAEGRIVAAGAAADRGDLQAAIVIMEPATRRPKRVREHHLRQWYVLGDLHDRAGDPIAAARFFEMVAANDIEFADVRSRLDALGR